MKNDLSKKLEVLFSMFVSKDKDRPKMLTPFEDDGKVCATDCQVLIRADKELCNFEFQKQTTGHIIDTNAVFPQRNTNKKVEIVDYDFEKYRTEDEQVWTGNNVECGCCKGDGSFTEYIYYKNKSYDAEYDCPVCEGTGNEEQEKLVLTGKKILENKPVKVGNSYINIAFMELLKIACLHLEEDAYIVSQHDPSKANVFQVGVAEILVMPLAYHSYQEPCEEIKLV